MKKVLSCLLVLTNLALSKSFACLASNEETANAGLPAATVVEEKKENVEAAKGTGEKEKTDNPESKENKNDEKGEKNESNIQNVENDGKTKKESISLEISAEMMEKIKKVLSSEKRCEYPKAKLAIETVLGVLCVVGLLCSIKNECFGHACPTKPPVVDEPAQPPFNENTQENIQENTQENTQNESWAHSAFDMTKRFFVTLSDKALNVFPFYLLLRYY